MTWEIFSGFITVVVVAVVLATRITRWHDSTEGRLKKLEDKVDRIFKFLQKNNRKPLERSSSPLSLTDYGQKIASQARASDIADIYMDKVFHSSKGKNPYEIQEHCFKFCEDDLLHLLEKDGHDELHKGVFSVAYEEGEDIGAIMRVIAYEFRDRILGHLGKDHDEIDRHKTEE